MQPSRIIITKIGNNLGRINMLVSFSYSLFSYIIHRVVMKGITNYEKRQGVYAFNNNFMLRSHAKIVLESD